MDIKIYAERLAMESMSFRPIERMGEVNLAAAVVVVKNGKILVADRVDGTGLCGPGGHMEEGEQFKDTAIRESKEEFSITLGQIAPVGFIKDDTGQYCDTMIYLCQSFSGEPIADGKEMINARWVSVEELMSKKLFSPFEKSLRLLIRVLTETIRADTLSADA